MDIDALVAEICRRVQEKLDDCGEVSASVEGTPLPKLLVLTDAHGEECHKTLECRKLAEYYQTECALLKEYDCRIEEYEAVVAYTLTNEALGKIAWGIMDTGYTRLFGQALLAGKKVFIPKEEVELYRYRETAPAAYYQRMEQNLRLLLDSGVVIAPREELAEMLLTGETAAAEETVSSCAEEPEVEEKEYTLYKKVITEKDVTAAHGEKATIVVVPQKAILTDLAKEYARKRNIQILRMEISVAKRG